MPGIIIFKRRWGLGSDDLVVPSLLLLVIHIAWLTLLPLILFTEKKKWRLYCMSQLMEITIGYVVIFFGCLLVEGFIAFVSTRGSIFNEAPRSSIQYLLHIRLGIFAIEVFWQIMGTIWLKKYYSSCPFEFPKDTILLVCVCNWIVIIISLVTVWCIYDTNGKSWAKTQRRVLNEYQDTWNRRFRLLFCCIGNSDRRQDSFFEIAKLLSEFFHDLDLVPSDIIAGLLLTRRIQKWKRQKILNENENSHFQFLSGISINKDTQFLDLRQSTDINYVHNLIHYLHYAIAIYGWPLYVMKNKSSGCFHLCRYFGYTNCLTHRLFSSNTETRLGSTNQIDGSIIVGDNCWSGNYAAFQKICSSHKWEMIYATYHVEIGQPPFFVIIDYDKNSVVISIRGTLSLQDVITDLNAEADILPTNPPNSTWLGHKGMVEAAVYIKKKLFEEKILERAFARLNQNETEQQSLVLVGHSLGAGTASILAILLKEKYPNIICFSYSPPGGLLSLPAVEYSKSFITSVILGKDMFARLGLHQMEILRHDLLNAIKQCKDSKWKVIGSRFCCCRSSEELDIDEADFSSLQTHPSLDSSNSSTALTIHHPLYPPGKIIHIVRSHQPIEDALKKYEVVYQGIWVDNHEYKKILISPVMIQDHMPDKLLDALRKLLTSKGSNMKLIGKNNLNSIDVLDHYSSSTLEEKPYSHRVIVETSFTDHQPVDMDTLYSNSSDKSPRPYILSLPKHHRDLRNIDWSKKAPLASFEPSIESSSLDLSSVYLNSNSTIDRDLESVEQSPASPLTSKIENLFSNSFKEAGGLDIDVNKVCNQILENFDNQSKKSRYCIDDNHPNSKKVAIDGISIMNQKNQTAK